MNIFVLDSDVGEAAKAHVDSHVIAMCKEYAQILSAVHHVYKSPITKLVYANNHIGNRFIKWASASKQNYDWLYSLWSSLHEEFMYRRGKDHESFLKLGRYLSLAPKDIPDIGITTPAIPNDSALTTPKSFDEAVQEYRKYYALRKAHLHTWSKRQTPEWLKKGSK